MAASLSQLSELLISHDAENLISRFWHFHGVVQTGVVVSESEGELLDGFTERFHSEVLSLRGR